MIEVLIEMISNYIFSVKKKRKIFDLDVLLIYYLKFIIFLSKNFHFDLDFCYLKKFDTVTWILHKTRAIMSQKRDCV